MSAKIFLYVLITILSLIGIESINVNNFFKKNRVFQARIFILFITFALSYLVTNFIYDFVHYSKI